MVKEHGYTARVRWTGNRGQGTTGYRAYDRTWDVATPGKPVIHCSNDPLLGGDPGLHNPEDMLLAALSACHMLWYLHYASVAGVVVLAYEDDPRGEGEVAPSGAGRFVSATLRPRITLAPGSDVAAAEAIHERIHEVCFIARSVAFPVGYVAEYVVATG
ncbi:OsmC family protein [Thalassovita taeanensis]|uniref:Organic hydroperoxide reductase OsmC/OhrA n=1 Tax=Thalassovita taeanensis TaxID=657014 RepID=A0A1H9EDX8_9RHOB|nr:OsmC family protein [Thalassovita taeanensis]SEQ23920.1 Organic hydroperoxide reductase OsmC/OhrA [Thalassovita taeanensis]